MFGCLEEVFVYVFIVDVDIVFYVVYGEFDVDCVEGVWEVGNVGDFVCFVDIVVFDVVKG